MDKIRKYHCPHSSCFLSALKGASNGVYYGTRVRLLHSIVISLLFKRSQSLKNKIMAIFKATFEHGKNLGCYVLFYKLLQCLLNRIFDESRPIHSFLSGFLVGGFVFKNPTQINIQIILYLLARNVSSCITYLTQNFKLLNLNKFVSNEIQFQIIAGILWALVLFLFELDKSVLQESLQNSMDFLYKETDQWGSYYDFIPFSESFVETFSGLGNLIS